MRFMPDLAFDFFSVSEGPGQVFRDAAWRHVIAVGKLHSPSEFFATNFHCPVWSEDIANFVQALRNAHLVLPRVRAVIGGPTCQGSSPLGQCRQTETAWRTIHPLSENA
jgi:site-specific DNA-cytosine methylase